MKIKKLFILITSILLLTGCTVKETYSMKISNNKSLDYSVIYAFDNDALKNIAEKNNTTLENMNENEIYIWLKKVLNESTYTSFNTANLIDQNFSIKEYKEDGYIGYQISTHVKNIDKLVNNGPAYNLSETAYFNERTLLTRENGIYNLKITNDLMDDLNKYNGLEYKLLFKLEMPSLALSSNATEINGNTYSWDLSKTNELNMSFEIKASMTDQVLEFIENNTEITIALGAIFLIITIILIMGNSKNKTKNNTQNSVLEPVTENKSITENTDNTDSVQNKIQQRIMEGTKNQISFGSIVNDNIPSVEEEITNEPTETTQNEITTEETIEEEENIQLKNESIFEKEEPAIETENNSIKDGELVEASFEDAFGVKPVEETKTEEQ